MVVYMKTPTIPGTTLILLATNGLTKYKAATGAVVDATTGLLRITSAQFSALQSLFFIAGGVRASSFLAQERILTCFNLL